jgi:MscS family membrane protein
VTIITAKEVYIMDVLLLTSEQWFDLGLSVFIVLATLFIGQRVVRFLLEKVIRRIVRKTETTFDDVILQAIVGPLNWLLILLVLKFSIKRLDFLPPTWNETLDTSFYILYFVLGAVFILRLVSAFFVWYSQHLKQREEMSLAAQMLPFIRRIVLILVGSIAIVSLLGHYIDISALLTTLGVGSLAIALAAQTALEDLFNGLLIMFDRPYLIGDRIEIQQIDTWGDVVDIGLRSTRIRTRDNRFVVIPNSIMGRSMVINYSRPDTQYRIQIEIGLAYGTDIETARQTIIDAVRNVEGVLPERNVEALLLQFGESALVFRVRWWLDSYIDTRTMFDRVNTAIYAALNEAGIVFASPQLDTHHYIHENEALKLSQAFQEVK